MSLQINASTGALYPTFINSDPSLKDSVNGWFYSMIESSLHLSHSVSDYAIIDKPVTVLKFAANTVILPLFTVAALVETVVRSALFFVAKLPDSILFWDTDSALWMSKNVTSPLLNSINLNTLCISRYIYNLIAQFGPIHLNGYETRTA